MNGDRADRVVDAAIVAEEDAEDHEHAGDDTDDRRAQGSTNAQGAVIATRPASMPLHIIDGIGLHALASIMVSIAADRRR